MDQVAPTPVLAPAVSTVPPSMDCSVAPLTGLALAVAQVIADPSLGVPATVVSGRKVLPDVMPPPTSCEVNIAPRTGLSELYSSGQFCL